MGFWVDSRDNLFVTESETNNKSNISFKQIGVMILGETKIMQWLLMYDILFTQTISTCFCMWFYYLLHVTCSASGIFVIIAYHERNNFRKRNTKPNLHSYYICFVF